MKYAASLTLLLIFIPTSQAISDAWQLQRNENGIQIRQLITNTGYATTHGSLVVDASINALLVLMRDNSSCRRWLHACKQSRLVSQEGANKRLDYTVVDSPYFYADRDMYVFSELAFDRAKQIVTVRMSGRETHDKGQRNRVRLRDLQGYWRLRKISDGTTAVEYQIYSNPQLAPSKYLNGYLVGSVFLTLQNLARVSQEDKYRNADSVEFK